MLAGLLSILLCVNEPEHELTGYFLNNKTKNHVILDRESDKTTISIAATGFGYYAWAIAAEDGTIPKETASEWISKSIDYVLEQNPKANHGWLYHFLDNNGKPKFNNEISSVDTAIFYLGAKKAATRLNDQILLNKINNIIDKIDNEWMMTNGDQNPNKKLFSHGLNGSVWLNSDWDEHNEGILLYKLFNIEFKPTKFEPNLPLFVYYYIDCFFPCEENNKNINVAIDWQIKNYGYCGVTACDGPNGYSINNKNIISPLSLWACSKVSPKAAESLAKMKYNKLTPSYDIKSNWAAKDKVGIDFGSCLMMLKN